MKPRGVLEGFQRRPGGRAAVYARQSSLEQVTHNTGSREAQLAQREVARELGYPDDLIEVYEDAGLTGSAAEHRLAYQRMLADVRKGDVDLIIAADPSRLGRDAAEWLSLMYLCRIHGVRLMLDRKLVDPTQGDERFATGVQAIFAEYDNWRRSEWSRTGRLSKLKHGKAVTTPPAGYVWGPNGTWLKDSRPNVQESIEAHYLALREGRSLIRAVQLLRERQVESPAHRAKNGLGWSKPTASTVGRFVHHPAYVGDAVYGRLRGDPTLPRDRKGRFRLRRANADDVIIIADHHDPYLTRDEQREFKQLLQRNAFAGPHGVLGKGQAKAQGLVRCGKHRQWKMSAVVKKVHEDGAVRFDYVCAAGVADGVKRCGSIPGWVIDEPLFDAVLERLRPHAIDALAATIVQTEADARSEARRRRETLHRLRCEKADLQELSRRTDRRLWTVVHEYQVQEHEKNLQIRQLEQAATQTAVGTIRDVDLQELRELCSDLDDLLGAPTTEPRDCKELVRIMVDRVVVDERTREHVALRIVWNDQAPDTARKILLFPYAHRMIKEWTDQGVRADQIATRLNQLGVVTKYRTKWTEKAVVRQLARMSGRKNR